MALSKIDVANMLTGLVPNDNTIRRPNAKPLIINGNMAVAQRATSVTGVGDGDTGYNSLDRWRFSEGGDNSTVFTMSQNTDVPTGQGFANSLKMDVTTADASPGSSDAMFLQQRFEGQDLQLLKKGTSSAEKITVSFWVKSSKTGTHILEVQDSDNTRNCSQSYTVSSADTWEKKVVVFPADTTGALDDDTANSFEVNWWLLAGTDFTSGTLATSFASRTNANRAVGQVNIGDNTSNNFYMTGCQMEIGEFSSTTLPPFQHENFSDNLLRCQRYYVQLGTVGDTQSGFPARAFSSSGLMFAASLAVPLRADPSTTLVGTIRAFDDAGTKDSTSNFSLANYSNKNSNIIMLQSTGFSSLSNDNSYNVMAINDTAYKLDAEL